MPSARRFVPGAIDYNAQLAVNYRRGRALSDEAAKTWVNAVAPFVRPAQGSTIVDVGAGTGRFSQLFARSFDAYVIAVDPSHSMLAAAPRESLANPACVGGSAERLPLRDGSCDVAWLSHVWHHVRNRPACASELRRVVRRGGHALVRGTFGDRLDGYPATFRYWPSVRDICAQLPTTGETVAMFTEASFVVRDRRRIQQTTCGSLRELSERTRLRADSGLALISDAEFLEGQAAIEEEASRELTPVPVVETIEFLIFGNR